MVLQIGVIGGHKASPAEIKVAESVGEKLALAGAVLVCGGLTGVMEAACRGAKRSGGVTIGILPGLRAEDANQYVDYPIVTGIGDARNSIVVRSAQAVIAVAGSTGTLSEIAYALKSEIPVISLNSWDIPGVHQVDKPAAAVELALELADGKG